MLPLDYSWFEAYLLFDSILFDDILNWEDSLGTLFDDFGLIFFLTASFSNTLLSVDSVTKLAFLDIIFYVDFAATAVFSLAFFLDLYITLHTEVLYTLTLFTSEYQDITSPIFVLDPSLLLTLQTFCQDYWCSTYFGVEVGTFFDTYIDNPASPTMVVFEILFLSLIFGLWGIIVFGFVSPLVPTFVFNYVGGRFYFYLNSISHENRIQLDALLQAGVLFFLVWTSTLLVFDDDYEEVIEFMDSNFFSIFLILILFLIFRYSIHFFAFLEASDVSGRSTLFILKQFFRDFMGSLGLFLRFFILIFRLNVYDNLDDLLESYYIVVCDFDDDIYLSDFFLIYLNKLSFFRGFEDDRSLYLENELDSYYDFFMLFFLVFAKFVLFLFFLLEEIFRVGLALYISYLIVFEVHASNASWNESHYLGMERAKLGWRN